MKKQTLYVLLVAAFIILSLVMNITAVISVPFIPGVEGLGIERLDGSILSAIEITWAAPLAAIMMVVADLLSECFTKKETVLAIILGYAGGLFLSLYLLIGQALVGDYISNNFSLIVDGNLVAHFLPWDALGQSWRFLLAGFIAYVIANYVNTGIMWTLKARDGKKGLWKRIMISTLIAQIVDNLFFLGIAFAPLGISALEKSYSEILIQVGVSVALEVVIEALISPITVVLSKKINNTYEYIT